VSEWVIFNIPLYYSCCRIRLIAVLKSLPYLSSAHVKDTLGYTSTPVFSVSLSTAACSASSHAMPIDFKSRDTVSIQFDLGLPALLVHKSICHRVACFGILSHSIRSTCPSHLNLLSLMMRSILCSFVWFRMSSLRTLSFHVIHKSRHWNLWCATFSFFFCGIVRGHSSQVDVNISSIKKL